MKQVIIQENNFQNARKKIREAKKSNVEIIFTSSDDDLNRKILEKEKIDILLLSLSKKRDKMKQRDSGFNQVLSKLAKKNNVVIGINLDEILKAGTLMEKSEILARVRQNVRLCNKNKLKMKFIPITGEKKDKYDLKSLGISIGMPTGMTKDL